MKLVARVFALLIAALSLHCSGQEPAPPRPPGALPVAGPRPPTPAALFLDPAASSGYAPDAGPIADAGPTADAGSDAMVIVSDQPFQAPFPPYRNVRKSIATRLASLSPGQCRAELRRRKIGSRPPGFATPGVATPMRLTGALHGVQFIAPGARSVFGILDCRLALVLDELAQVLDEQDVFAVHVDSFYRPRSRLPGSRKPSQHSHGLAVDVIAFTLGDGRTLTVKNHWRGALATQVCGPGSQPVDPTPEALKLWTIVCDIAQKGFFHHMLTPNFNKAHEDHLHFDIKRDGESLNVH